MSRAESQPHEQYEQRFDRWTAIGGLAAGGALVYLTAPSRRVAVAVAGSSLFVEGGF